MSKTSGEVLQSFFFIIKSGGGELIQRGRQLPKISNKYNWPSRVYNITRQVRYRSHGVAKEYRIMIGRERG